MGERRTRGPRAAARPPKHGARALARHLAAGTLDRRTWVAKEFDAIGNALADDRGGLKHCTAAERLLIERCAAVVLFLRSIEAWSFRQPSIIVETMDGPRLLGPLAKGYTAHLGALTRTLAALGLRPDIVERLPSLREYLADRAASTPPANGAPTGTSAADPADALPPAPPGAPAMATPVAGAPPHPKESER